MEGCKEAVSPSPRKQQEPPPPLLGASEGLPAPPLSAHGAKQSLQGGEAYPADPPSDPRARSRAAVETTATARLVGRRSTDGRHLGRPNRANTAFQRGRDAAAGQAGPHGAVASTLFPPRGRRRQRRWARSCWAPRSRQAMPSRADRPLSPCPPPLPRFFPNPPPTGAVRPWHPRRQRRNRARAGQTTPAYRGVPPRPPSPPPSSRPYPLVRPRPTGAGGQGQAADKCGGGVWAPALLRSFPRCCDGVAIWMTVM